MIKVETCTGCADVILVDDFMGLRVRCGVEPVDAHAATTALLASQTLYRVQYEGGRPHQFARASHADLATLRGPAQGRAKILAPHQCTKAATTNGHTAPQSAPQKAGGTGAPKAPQSLSVDRGAPFSGPLRRSSTAPTAATPVSKIKPTSVDGYSRIAGEEAPVGVMTFDTDPRNPKCSGCGRPCADGTYSAIHLGELLVWAEHLDGECTP